MAPIRKRVSSKMLGSGQKVLIPGKALSELQRLLGDTEELTVRLGERDATFEVGGKRLTTRLIEGDFPNYRNLLPSNYPNLLTVGKAALSEAIGRVKILAQDSTPVRLALGEMADALLLASQRVRPAKLEASGYSFRTPSLEAALRAVL